MWTFDKADSVAAEVVASNHCCCTGVVVNVLLHIGRPCPPRFLLQHVEKDFKAYGRLILPMQIAESAVECQ